MHPGERFNSITHGVGIALAIAGSAVLIATAALSGDAWKVVSFSIYSAMLVTLYAVSTLYHAFRGRAKDVLRKLDHCAIYLLIAGTYTPFTLVTLRGAFGWTLFGVIWTLAVLGIVQEVLFARGARWLSLALYLVMGWLGASAAVPLLAVLGPSGVAWLVAGGLLYTGGVVFYVYDEQWRHAHGIWHLFVLAGSTSHFVTVMFFVA
jgi:hemolysin III